MQQPLMPKDIKNIQIHTDAHISIPYVSAQTFFVYKPCHKNVITAQIFKTFAMSLHNCYIPFTSFSL